MKLTEDRISNICHKIHDRLYLDEVVDYTDEDEALRVIKSTFLGMMQLEEKIDEAVRAKIASLKRGVIEGTPEWDVLHRKYAEEEMAKHKM
ncbi:DUF507 family protein [bacterium]|nr:DUF507 family protein [bacterium]